MLSRSWLIAAATAAVCVALPAEAATVVVDGSLPANRVNYISFSYSGGAISFAATPTSVPSSTSADLMLRLFADNGSPFGALTGADLANDDDGGPDYDPLLSINNLASGAYILAVGAFNLSDAEARSGIASTPSTGFSYRVTITSDPAVSIGGAVPEPTTWATMLLGFGMVAGATRYRRRKSTVTFA